MAGGFLGLADVEALTGYAGATGGVPVLASNTPINFIFLELSMWECSGAARDSLRGVNRSRKGRRGGKAGNESEL